jgi:pyruvate formate lyase activating enzyme
MEVTGSVMLDVKADPENEGEYKLVTGRNCRDLLEKMEFLARAGKLWEVRTVVSPGLFDIKALVEKVCRRLAKNRKTGLQGQAPGANAAITPQYKLIRYRPIGVRPTAAASLVEPNMELMDTLAQICTKHGIKAVVV